LAYYILGKGRMLVALDEGSWERKYQNPWMRGAGKGNTRTPGGWSCTLGGG